MPQHARPQVCLSTKEHDNRVLDVSKHYFGCLRESEREYFKKGLPEKSRRRICNEASRIAQLRTKLEYQPQSRAGTLLKGFKEAISDWRGVYGWVSVEDETPAIPPGGLETSADSEIKASMIFFRDSRPYNIPGIENTFPNQKIPIKDLLADEPDKNPLMRPCHDNVIRYFHLPANNMIWVEVDEQEAIARYYHEKRPDAQDLFLNYKLGRKRTKTEMLLAPEFWQGQQNFDRTSEVHARHMRPLCDVISTNPISTEPMPKNLVLFMPYLHWETDRGRIHTTAVIKEASTIMPSIAEIVDQATAAKEQSSHPDRNFNTQANLDPSRLRNNPLSPATKAQKKKILGAVLMLAAALVEAIDCRIEEALILEYLHQNPPLHPRRTLDQSHYVGLKDTSLRDQDQVVYRATIPGEHNCDDNRDRNDPWKRCKQCQEDSRKVPRLIMVDQLWLWILDERTVLTCFPRRFGKIRPDPSAVHKSLRMRLKTGRQDEIRSAYDLALVIIDECSRVFFDRSKAVDRQPNLVDMFASAIRNVTSSQTAAFDLFLIYTNLVTKDYGARDTSTLLNINPEGKLFKEIKDILDELDILIQIKLKQQSVVHSFVKHVKHFLQPHLISRSAWHPMISLNEDDDGDEPSSGQKKRRADARLTMTRADHLLDDIQDRIRELRSLEENARKTATALKDILALKQQQAGVIEAREAVQQAKETLAQGKSIMLFTVVTIIFLPLSFCTSVFGMNTAEFNDTVLTFAQEVKYTLPISISIIALSFLLAFGHNSTLSSLFSLVSALLLFPINIASTWLLIKSGLFELSCKMATKATALKDNQNKTTAMMKADAMRDMREKVKLLKITKIFDAAPTPEDDEGLRTPRVRGMTSRMGTPRPGGTPHLAASGFYEDVERAQNSRSGSQIRLMN